MPLIVKDNSTEYELAPEGTHIARCYQVIDLGLQQTSFGEKPKVLINFELPMKLMADGRPFSVGNRYTPSLNKKAILRQHLEAWRGRSFTEEELDGFDLYTVCGVPAMITVVHTENNDRRYANIVGIAKLPAEVSCPDAINPMIRFSTQDYTQQQYDALPDWMHNVIKFPQKNLESKPELSMPDEDIPF